MTKGDKLWTEQDVADYLQVSVRTVQRMKIPREPMPTRGTRTPVRYDPERLKAFLAGKIKARKAR